MDFQLDLAGSSLKVGPQSVPFTRVGKEPWFRANDIAAALRFKHPANAISRHFDQKGRHAKYSKSLGELLAMDMSHPCGLDGNDRKAKWINEAGVYKLAFHSKTAAALDFQDWICESVLPSIRASGTHKQTDWAQERMDSTHVSKLRNASIKELIGSCFGGKDGQLLFNVMGEALNRALLDFTGSTEDFQKRHCLPGWMPIQSLLAFDGQLLRDQMERKFADYIKTNWTSLQALGQKEASDKMEELGAQMQQGNRMGGYTVQVAGLECPGMTGAKKQKTG